jgi:putative ABC transport system permease protein
MTFFGGKDPKAPNESLSSLAADASCIDVMDDLVIDPAQRDAWLANRQGAIVGDLLARKLGLKIGDRITLEGTSYPGEWSFEVVATYTALRKSVDRSTFVFHWEYLNDSLPEWQRDQVGWISAKINDPTRAAEIGAQIDSIFDQKDVQTSTMSERAMHIEAMGQISALLTALDAISVIILVIMTMILGNTIAMGMRERAREYGILQAIGFRLQHIMISILGEALVLGLVAGALGVALAVLFIGRTLGPFLEENLAELFPYFQVEPWTAVAALALSVALPVVATVLPAYQMSRRPVVDALRRLA